MESIAHSLHSFQLLNSTKRPHVDKFSFSTSGNFNPAQNIKILPQPKPNRAFAYQTKDFFSLLLNNAFPFRIWMSTASRYFELVPNAHGLATLCFSPNCHAYISKYFTLRTANYLLTRRLTACKCQSRKQ